MYAYTWIPRLLILPRFWHWILTQPVHHVGHVPEVLLSLLPVRILGLATEEVWHWMDNHAWFKTLRTSSERERARFTLTFIIIFFFSPPPYSPPFSHPSVDSANITCITMPFTSSISGGQDIMGLVTVVIDDDSVSRVGFNYVEDPTITGISPNIGFVGWAVALCDVLMLCQLLYHQC